MKPPQKEGVCEADASGVDYCASSVLPASKTNHYEPSMLFDGNPATAWVEGVSEDGIGETITLHFDRQRSLLGFEIINGYGKNQKIWSANSRVETLEASTGDGQIQVITLKDVRGPEPLRLRRTGRNLVAAAQDQQRLSRREIPGHGDLGALSDLRGLRPKPGSLLFRRDLRGSGLLRTGKLSPASAASD